MTRPFLLLFSPRLEEETRAGTWRREDWINEQKLERTRRSSRAAAILKFILHTDLRQCALISSQLYTRSEAVGVRSRIYIEPHKLLLLLVGGKWTWIEIALNVSSLLKCATSWSHGLMDWHNYDLTEYYPMQLQSAANDDPYFLPLKYLQNSLR